MRLSDTRSGEEEGSEGRDFHEVVEMDGISPASTEHATIPHAADIELHEIGPPPKSSRRPASFDAAAILQWRSQGIALPLSPSPSSSSDSSPTLVASTYSPGKLSASSGKSSTGRTTHKRQLSASKLWRRTSHSPTRASHLRIQPLHIAACTLVTLLLSWYLLGGTCSSLWQPRLFTESLNLEYVALFRCSVSCLEYRTDPIPKHITRCVDPYTAPGRLDHSNRWPDATRWLPYEPTCFPPPLLATLRAGLESKPSQFVEPSDLEYPLRRSPTSADTLLTLPWLSGKTVVLVGDGVELAHAKDFCRYTAGEYAVVTSDHPLSPPPFVNGIDEKWVQTQGTMNETRPTVCYLPNYDFTLINIFHFGLANRVEFEHESIFSDPHFYPPGGWHSSRQRIHRTQHLWRPKLTRCSSAPGPPRQHPPAHFVQTRSNEP